MFLERAALAAVGVSLESWLSGCASDSAPRDAARMPFDPNKPWWLQNNFAPVMDELDAFDLRVSGAIPAELSGLYVRNGSNPQKSDSPHWFFGDGMLHGVRFERGKASWYRNRYVRTKLFVEGESFGSGEPPAGGANQSNVSVVWHAGKLLSSGEVGFPYELDPASLETKGVFDFGGALTTSFTAHPKIDPVTGNLHYFGYWFVPPYLTYTVVSPTGQVLSNQEIGVAGPTMIHSFAITERDAVFWELPVVFDLDAALAGADNPFRWDESYGARIGVMPLGGNAADMRWVEIPPCYVFHEVNAYRDGSDVVVDVCRHPDMFNGSDLGEKPNTIHRWRVDTSGTALRFTDELIADLEFELPTHDRRYTGRQHRNGWFVTTRENPNSVELAGIGHIDVASGQVATWDPGATRHADEAFFVPAGSAEGEGWLLSFVYDHSSDSSVLAVLDATRIAAGPVAQIHLPRRVPHGFHAVWIPD